jgi:predicted Ser/Thr protein kinase
MTTSTVDPLFLQFQLALAGRYSIDRELGRGGMGIVYLAREVHLDRMVAIKLLPPDRASEPSVRDHFLREARLAAKLSHPNIIPIHAVDETQGFVFYVMAFIDGETLAQRVQTRGPLSSAEAARVLREVAWALSHAHSHGLVHRDVKPDNILLESGTGRVLVTDFGIASAETDAHTSVRLGVGGSPEFMSPEQALGKHVDARSDVYALGITAFFALSGRLPFEGSNAVELLARQVTEAPPLLASMGVPVPRKIALLVERCMAKDPAQRPASADALAEQLGVALEQRRELPAALRAFVKRDSRLNRGGILPLFLLYGIEGIVAANFGLAAAVGVFVFGTAAVGFGYLVHSARRLMRLGFAHSDVGPAYAAEIELGREERAGEHGGGPSRLEKILLNAARISAAVMGGSVVALILGVSGPIAGVGFWAGLITAPSAIIYLSMLERRRDIDSEFWGRVWKGRIGKAAFWLARKMLGRGVRANAVTHRATELALGMTAESLFEALPQPTRRALGDVPAVVHRLQDDAQRLRKLYDEVQEAVAAVGDVSSLDAQGQLRADRDRIHAKLGDAVGALETIRLNLLRLHAGSGSAASFTIDIDFAAELAADVERLLAARQDVQRALAFPRKTAPTPA